ncbi:MAG: hypothetical protein NDJ89_16255 [Oligoflexia bacterium]|nr:hypothetical protein [Oligoflexia bacterium]
MKTRQRIIVQSVLLAAATALAFPACKSDKGKAVTYPPRHLEESCYIFGQTLYGAHATDCCEKNGSGVWVPKPSASQPAGRCPSAPGLAAVTTAMNTFQEAVNVGRSGVESARRLENHAEVSKNSRIAAATAAQPKGGEVKKTDGPIAAGELGELVGSSSGGGAYPGSAGGGGGGLGGGGSGSGLSDVRTSAAPRVQTEPEMVRNPDTASGGYTGGGGGGGAVGGAGFGRGSGIWDSLAGGAGLGGNGVEGGAPKSMTFGRDPASMNAMGSADPEDYFSRVKPGDSIFKVVERRYTSKAQNWALSDAKK